MSQVKNNTPLTVGDVIKVPVEWAAIEQHLEDGWTANPEWLAWRAKSFADGPRITATMATAIAGVSPYQTRYGLWPDLTKQTALISRTPLPEFVLKRGLQSEADALVAFRDAMNEHEVFGLRGPFEESELGGVLVCRERDLGWVSASLDGCLMCAYSGLPLVTAEFKLNGAVAHAFPLTKRCLPPHHYTQVQWQMLAAGAETSFYVSTPFSGEGERVILEVAPDPEYQQQMLDDVIAFRRSVVTMTPPPIVGAANTAVMQSAAAYLRAKARMEDFEAETLVMENNLRATLDANAYYGGYTGCGIVYKLAEKKGSVAWAKIIKEMKIDIPAATLAQFTGKPSSTMELDSSADADGFLAAVDGEIQNAHEGIRNGNTVTPPPPPPAVQVAVATNW